MMDEGKYLSSFKPHCMCVNAENLPPARLWALFWQEADAEPEAVMLTPRGEQ